MARKARLYYPGALYHVMLRGNGGQPIFFSPPRLTTILSLAPKKVTNALIIGFTPFV